MRGDLLGDEEEVIRAIPFAKFNHTKRIVSFQAFIDRNGVSVGRTKVLAYEELLSIYVNDFHHPPVNPLIATVGITVGRIKAAVPLPPPALPEDPPVSAEVENDEILVKTEQESVNPAHALVHGLTGSERRKFTPGQAKRVLEAADKPRYYAEGYPGDVPT